MRRLFLISVIIAVAVALVFSGCAKEAPAPSPVPGPAPAPAPVPAPAQQIKIIVNTPSVPMGPPGVAMKEWSSKIEEASSGRVKFTLYYSSSLFQPTEALRSVLGGVADVFIAYSSREDPGLMVLNNFYQLPFLGIPNSKVGTKVIQDLLDNFPGFKEEFQGVKVYAPAMPSNDGYLNTTKRQVLKRADMAGMRVISDGPEAQWFSLMGAAPVNVPFPDRYMSLEKGLVEGDFSHFGPIVVTGSLPLYKYHLVIPVVPVASVIVGIFNPDTWNSLPPDIQKIFSDMEPVYRDRYIDLDNQADVMCIKQAKEMGHIVSTLSPEEVQLWKSVAMPLHEKWIKDTEGKGKPGRQLYDEVQRLIAKYSSE